MKILNNALAFLLCVSGIFCIICGAVSSFVYNAWLGLVCFAGSVLLLLGVAWGKKWEGKDSYEYTKRYLEFRDRMKAAEQKRKEIEETGMEQIDLFGEEE